MELMINLTYENNGGGSGDISSASEWWQETERAGAAVLAFPDSPLLRRDVYVTCARLSRSNRVSGGHDRRDESGLS